MKKEAPKVIEEKEVSQSVEEWNELVRDLTQVSPMSKSEVRMRLATFAEKIREEIRSTIISIPKTHTADDCVVIKDEDYDDLLAQLKK